MQPSSLVFLVIIAIWAAYLLQHWVRRREHLATARSVDRFSEAMRVLERRTPPTELDLSASRPHSYDVSPARPSRPEVVVKRAQPSEPQASTGPAVGVRPTRIFHVLAGISARRVRGLSLLVSLSMAIGLASLAAFLFVPWWSVPIAVTVLVADVAWLRHGALSERAARRAKASEGGSADGPVRPSTLHSAAPEFGSARESEFGSEPVVVAALAGVAEVAEPPESPAEGDQSGWAPIPVPPPTYTLKAKAEPPSPVTEQVAVTDSASAQSLSLDGLVYDYDLDELVERRHVVGG